MAISNSISENLDTEKIFDKFYRADVSRKGEGSGLGLYICRKFVEAMDGKIYAGSENERLTINIEFMK
ncbi:MAG: sensor histidine kinase [Clostridia bacterium]|nr:sensor histidine kinase [Clostridia bacterium]